MKIALITIQNANNYGAILQAYALQQVLSQYGDVEVINYDNHHIGISFDLVRVKLTWHGVMGMGKDILRIVPRYKTIQKFSQFISEYLTLTIPITDRQLQLGELGHYDVYVAGSDQIWNPSCISAKGLIDPIYLLSFAPQGARKISYGSSRGGYQFSLDEKKQIKGLLQGFSAISVREEDTQLLMQEFLDKDVHHVLDPTLLLSKEEWLTGFKFDKKLKQSEKYILLYSVPKTPLIRQVVTYFAKKTGLKVIAIDQGITAGAKVNEQIRDAGPIEFLQLFANAEFVITDSFHGVCFSLNFAIPFVAISSGVHSNRIESLLMLVGLKNRYITTFADLKNLSISTNFSMAQQNLVQARCESLLFLLRSLNVAE